jgi:DNA-binding LacI/PurR family transcriptional regulator
VRQKVRISDVAKAAGVSAATVSAVVNNPPGSQIRVGDATRQRIWDAVHALGYVPNPVARSLAGGKNQIIGIFTYESIFPLEYHNFYYPFLIGLEEEAQARGYDLLLFTSAAPPGGGRSVFRQGANRLSLADGVIFLGLNENKEELATLVEEGYPIVFIGRRELLRGELSYTAADYAQATSDVYSHLTGLGHCQIAYLHTSVTNESKVDRLQGYQRSAAANNAGSGLTWRIDSQMALAERLPQWLAQGVTAFMVEDDDLGTRLLAASDALGLTAPKDFSLAVLGDPLSPRDAAPAWTTFRIPRRAMGAGAVQLLLQLLDNPEGSGPYRQTIACELVPGTTTGPAPTR